MIRTQTVSTPLGAVTLVSDGTALTGLYLEGQKHMPAVEGEPGDLPVFTLARRWLAVYFSGKEPDFTPPLALCGTPFQTAVWDALRSVPYGETVSYGELAKRLSSSARAVGTAVGRNPVLLIVPCHRAVGKNGALTGYAGGLERKAALLELERTGRRIGDCKRLHNKAGANMGQPA